jgi:predicted GNAT superfamily acetyltransferase
VTSSFLHRFGTDRLWVTWLLESERVAARMEGAITPRVVHDEDVVIEIPAEITENHEYWRATTRAAFTRALDAGYVVQEFFVSPDRRTGRYILSPRMNAD